MKREPGYYWVKVDQVTNYDEWSEVWVIAKWCASNTWAFIGTDDTLDDDELIEIDEIPITRKQVN